MQQALGKKCWVVPDGYIPCATERDRENLNGYLSHECACLLNTGSKDARVVLTVYFENKEPALVSDILLAGRRCLHLRMDQLKKDGAAVIDRGVPYALVITADEPIVVQMSRLDTTQPNMAFLSTMAYPVE
jgi:hypothetical protein